MADIQFEASLDADQILKTLKSIDGNIDKLANQGDSTFKKIGQSAKLSGVDIGAVSGFVQELTSRFIDLGLKAVSTFAEITARGVELNKNIETAGRVFGAAFGDPKLGKATIDFIDEISEKLNINQGEATAFAQSILPKTGSLDEFTELLKLTDIQADATNQTISDLEFSIREALSGDFVSLKDRFDLSRAQIDDIKELSKEVGLAQAIIKVVTDDFERLGKVNIQDTLATDIKAVQAEADDLNRVFSAPAFEELKDLFGELGDILSERGDDFELIADTFGRVVANVIDFIGSGLTDFLKNLDTEQVIRIGENFFDLVDNARTLAEVLNLLELPQTLLDSVDSLVEKLSRATQTAVQIGAIAKAEIARRQAEEEVRARQGNTALGGFVTFAGTEEQEAEQLAAGQAAFNKVIQDSLGIIEESTRRKDENREATERLREEQETAEESHEAEIDALLRSNAAAAEAAEARERLAGVQEKVNEETQKLTEKLIQIEADAENKRLEALISNSQKREDIARNDARKLEDIERKHNQDIKNARRDIGRGGEDLARKQGRERLALERNLQQKTIDAEVNFRQKLQDIQGQFQQSAEEASRSRDAISFLRAQRQRDQAVQSAQQDRQQEQQSAIQDAERQRQELAIRQQQEVEDARIANQRKLDDLRESLARRIEEQRIANERDLEDQKIAEERKTEELKRQEEQRLQAARDAAAKKITELTGTLAQEIRAVASAEAQKTAIIAAEAERQRQIRASAIAAAQQQAEQGGSGSLPRGRRGGRRGRRPGRAFGGAVIAGQTVQVLDSPTGGPELFTPSVSGSITPLSQLGRLPLAPITNNAGNVDNSISATVNQSLLDPSQQSAMMRMIAQAEAQKLLKSVLRRR